MQITSHSSALVVFALLSNGLLANGISLRKQPPAELTPGALSLVSKVQRGVNHEVVKKTSIEKKSSTDCLCKIGTFWHWRIKSCIKQGGWAYECGFFPEEHHDKVCQDGLKCEKLNQTAVKYIHPGAVPASCQACTKEDKCLTGETRHNENCLKEYKLTGKACQTVKVTVGVTTTVEVTKKVKETATASATAEASATETAKAKAGAEKADATKTATAEGKATEEAKASAEASAKATATEDGTATGEGCITIEEVKKLLGLEKVKAIGAVLSAKVVTRGDKEAYDRAYAKALEAAQKAGLINAKEAATAIATKEATEKAAEEAKARAEEAAAWAAEAGADEAAQEKAKEAAYD